jgi:hypothetical protein
MNAFNQKLTTHSIGAALLKKASNELPLVTSVIFSESIAQAMGAPNVKHCYMTNDVHLPFTREIEMVTKKVHFDALMKAVWIKNVANVMMVCCSGDIWLPRTGVILKASKCILHREDDATHFVRVLKLISAEVSLGRRFVRDEDTFKMLNYGIIDVKQSAPCTSATMFMGVVAAVRHPNYSQLMGQMQRQLRTMQPLRLHGLRSVAASFEVRNIQVMRVAAFLENVSALATGLLSLIIKDNGNDQKIN